MLPRALAADNDRRTNAVDLVEQARAGWFAGQATPVRELPRFQAYVRRLAEAESSANWVRARIQTD
jgi:hypothetical protein